jgi:hypothetical protein
MDAHAFDRPVRANRTAGVQVNPLAAVFSPAEVGVDPGLARTLGNLGRLAHG